MSRFLRIAAALLLVSLASCASSKPKGKTTEGTYRGARAILINGDAAAPSNVPAAVKRAIAAANAINHLPYQFGGGHGNKVCYGLDCSGTVSHVLRNSGLMTGSMTSKGFREFGKPGPGKYISVYARDGHAFMTICGLRLDTTSNGSGHVGPRWHTKPRSTKGFRVRHPSGL